MVSTCLYLDTGSKNKPCEFSTFFPSCPHTCTALVASVVDAVCYPTFDLRQTRLWQGSARMQPKVAAWYHADPMVRELFTCGGVEVGSWVPTMKEQNSACMKQSTVPLQCLGTCRVDYDELIITHSGHSKGAFGADVIASKAITQCPSCGLGQGKEE